MSDKKNDLWVGPATDENLAEFKKAQRPRDYDADKHDQLADFKRMKSKNHLAELVNERDELGAELETTREALRIAREERDTAIRERHECDMANAEAVHDLRAKLEVAEGDLAAAREGWDEARADLAMVRDRLTKVREWLDGLLPDVDISVSALTDGLGILEDDLPDSNEPEPQPIVKHYLSGVPLGHVPLQLRAAFGSPNAVRGARRRLAGRHGGPEGCDHVARRGAGHMSGERTDEQVDRYTYVVASVITVRPDPNTNQRVISCGHVVTSQTQGEVCVRLIPMAGSVCTENPETDR